jgi:hypothetical protein
MREKHLIIWKSLRISALAILFCAAGFQTAGAATLSLVPGDSSVNVGDTVSVDLDISGLVSGTALGAYDITVNIPTNFTLNDVVFGDPTLGDQLALSAVNSITEALPGNDSEELIEISLNSAATLDSFQASAFTLAVLNLTAESSGSGNFTLGDVTLSNAIGGRISSYVSDATISADSSAVPEPSSVLPLCGLVALIVVLRKRLTALAQN